MSLPVPRELAPMEARTVAELPEGPQWQYEPKWDGFRCLAFRDESEVELRSKSGQRLDRYFPEIVDAVRALDAKRFVLDGELVVPSGSTLSFDALLMRIHPAPSRVRRLAAESPARLIAFDLLVDPRGDDLTGRPLAERRPQLERFAKESFAPDGLLWLGPATTIVDDARRWLAGHEGTDGVIAKRRDLAYNAGQRDAMRKVKRQRTAECVVGGFRYSKNGKTVASLLLGLYDDAGVLHHVGFTSSLVASEKKRITPVLERLEGGPGFTGRAPGGPSRWSTERSSDWHPVQPKLVVEVQFDHASNERFRHGTKFLRWRPDKSPGQCTLQQLETGRHWGNSWRVLDRSRGKAPRYPARGKTRASNSRK